MTDLLTALNTITNAIAALEPRIQALEANAAARDQALDGFNSRLEVAENQAANNVLRLDGHATRLQQAESAQGSLDEHILTIARTLGEQAVRLDALEARNADHSA